MSHVALIDPTHTTPDRAELLSQVQQAFGAVPHMFRAVANSPAALRSMWGSFGALGGGTLPAKLGEQIAVAVADRNRCDYCLAAHTALGRKAGATAEEMAAALAFRLQKLEAMRKASSCLLPLMLKEIIPPKSFICFLAISWLG